MKSNRRASPVALLALVALFPAACSEERGRETRDIGVPPPIVVDFDPADIDLARMLNQVLDDATTQPESAEARGRLGMAYEMNDFKAVAIDTYEQAHLLSPQTFLWPYFRALLLGQAGIKDQALDALDTAMAIDGTYVPAWLWRGSWLGDLGRLDEALAAFNRAKALGGGMAAEAGVAQMLMRQGRHVEALDLLAPLADKTRHPHIYRLLGRTHQALGNDVDARIASARGRNASPLEWRDPRHGDKWDYLASHGGRLVHAEQLLRSGQFEDVIEVLEPMLENKPDDEVIFANLAMAHGRAGNMERALALLERGLEIDPTYYRFHNVFASLYYHRDEHEQAITHLEQAVALEPVQAWPYEQMGTIHMAAGRYDEALAAFDKALEYGTERPDAILYRTGMIEGAQERWPEAISRFERAVAVNEAFTMAYIYLGRSLSEAGRFEAAKTTLDWAERLDTHPEDLRKARQRLRTLVEAAPS